MKLSYLEKNLSPPTRTERLGAACVQLGAEVRRWPWPLRWYGNWKVRTVTWFWGSIWMADKVFYSWDLAEIVLAHELQHVRQYKACGKFRWMWRYLTNRKHRLAYEVAAEGHEAAYRSRLHGQSPWVHADALKHGKAPYCITGVSPELVEARILDVAEALLDDNE